ncbi:MAG: hypothetical protein F6K42_21595 [Leptolyngbya sp. SIO1D8]|nr:hypothetical protein [Leptolyngbya sp. SIO1D8]
MSINDLSGLLMVVFTCVITVANILLWLATRRTIKLQVASNYSLNHQSIVNGHRDLFLGLLHQPNILEKFATANNLDPVKWELQIISSFFINHAFIHYLNFSNGTLDKAYLEGFKRDAQEFLTLPTIQAHWQKARLGYSPAFLTFVEEELMSSMSNASISTLPPESAKA